MITAVSRSFVLLALLISCNAFAKSNLQINDAWIRATPPNSSVAGAFMRIENTGDSTDRLLSASSAGAQSIQFHQMSMQGELMQMRELKDGIDLPVQKTVTLQPGGMHMMLIGPKQALLEGQKMTLTLTFAKAGKRDVVFTVLKGAPMADLDMHEHH